MSGIRQTIRVTYDGREYLVTLSNGGERVRKIVRLVQTKSRNGWPYVRADRLPRTHKAWDAVANRATWRAAIV